MTASRIVFCLCDPFGRRREGPGGFSFFTKICTGGSSKTSSETSSIRPFPVRSHPFGRVVFDFFQSNQDHRKTCETQGKMRIRRQCNAAEGFAESRSGWANQSNPDNWLHTFDLFSFARSNSKGVGGSNIQPWFTRRSKRLMNYREAVDFLYQLQSFGTTLGLERTFKLAELAGRPQDKLRFIHVAGTNGKGSTCAMLESIYRHAGYRVGLFTSPHLISFAERIQVNRQLILEKEVARLVTEMRQLMSQLPAEFSPTLFEVVTVMALRWFAEQKCDLVIWETGLGGRLDATNIVTPLASVITNIQLDHEKWLGHTLAQIAREKAGIIKPGVPVITGVEEEEAWKVIKATAERVGAPVHRLGIKNRFKPSLLGSHQVKNAQLAVATTQALVFSLPSGADALIRRALQDVNWPGRFDLRGRFIFDGAHNPAGAKALRESIEAHFKSVKPTFIVGILADKDVTGMAREFAKVAGQILTVSVQSNRAMDALELAKQFSAIAPEVPVRACLSLEDALDAAENSDRIVITGSLHFIGEAMEFLGFEAGTGPSERALNDWSAKPK